MPYSCNSNENMLLTVKGHIVHTEIMPPGMRSIYVSENMLSYTYISTELPSAKNTDTQCISGNEEHNRNKSKEKKKLQRIIICVCA